VSSSESSDSHAMTQGIGILFFNFGNDVDKLVRSSVSSSRFMAYHSVAIYTATGRSRWGFRPDNE
jgi:hypothetical protein